MLSEDLVSHLRVSTHQISVKRHMVRWIPIRWCMCFLCSWCTDVTSLMSIQGVVGKHLHVIHSSLCWTKSDTTITCFSPKAPWSQPKCHTWLYDVHSRTFSRVRNNILVHLLFLPSRILFFSASVLSNLKNLVKIQKISRKWTLKNWSNKIVLVHLLILQKFTFY